MARAKRARRYGPGESLPGKVPLPRAEDEGGTCGERWGWVRWVGAEEVGGGATSDAKRQEVVVLVAERLQPAFEAALAPRRGRRRVEEREGVVRRERRGERRKLTPEYSTRVLVLSVLTVL